MHELPADVGQSSGPPGHGFYRDLVCNPGLWNTGDDVRTSGRNSVRNKYPRVLLTGWTPPKALNVLPDRTVSCGGPGLTAHQPDDPVSGRINKLSGQILGGS